MNAYPAPPLSSRRRFLAQSLIGGVGLGLGLSRRLYAQDVLAGRRKLGVALIGLGGYSTGQLGPALRETRFCELRGVVTGDPHGKGRRWARDYGFPESSIYDYDTMHRIADNPDIDIVYSVTPPGLHERDVLAGAASGKHVICEKPMATSVAECDRMIAACEEAGVRLSMGYRLHFHPYHQRVKALAAEAAWGGPIAMQGGFGYRMGTGYDWRVNKALAGGGQLPNTGIYVIQSALMAKGGEMPMAVTASEPPKTRPEYFSEVEETINWTFEWADGSKLEGTSSGVEGSNHFAATAANQALRLQPAFSYDRLRMELDGETLASMDGFNQQAHQMDAFAAAILTDGEDIVPAAMGRRDMVLIDAIYRASASGQAVAL
ncbi:Gfo/Idh/MocA family protein [Actomonas aquatica]|uniref:Gfo/Idh/MocA family oxidoreductase n=1 Tax=Actomonas aquatica TaxID=2866162 RepID=A0ABZ1C2V2_9BACT|nr:Gfo/Idh/MocA family oxidoreductase [Opitutus sp. WL0086]WRQ85685.1 Gfo/Idh/MocA family oxidoreductase [Opitutus sp. WL0086]